MDFVEKMVNKTIKIVFSINTISIILKAMRYVMTVTFPPLHEYCINLVNELQT